MGEFGSITTKYYISTDKYGKKNNVRNNLKTKTDIRMTKDGSVMSKKVSNGAPKQTSQTKNVSFADIVDAMGILNKSLNSITSQKANSSGTSSVSTPAASNSFNRETAASIPDNGASYSGLAQNVSADNSSTNDYDFSALNKMDRTISSSNKLSINELNDMKNELSASSVDVGSRLSSAEADFSNIRSQKLTAEANAARLESAVGNAKTTQENAKNTLDNNTSNLNSSVKARDTLDEQLSSVNEQYEKDCEQVKTQEQNKTSAQQEVSSAKTSKSNAQAAVSAAAQSLQAAETNLAGTPKTLDNGQPNPAYETARAAVEKAKAEKQQADEVLQQSEKDLDSAQQKLDNIETSLEKAQETKRNTLQSLQKTDSKYKDMAQKCEKMQDTVEQNQEAYDKSLETFDDTNANYQRLNAELEAQQGLLNQFEVYQNKVDNYKNASDKIKALNAKIDEQLKAKENMTNTMLEKAASSEGCSAAKTPAENFLSMKDGPAKLNNFAYTGKMVNTPNGSFVDESQMKALQGKDVIKEDASFFEKSGCIANADGSYTNSENGWTWINLKDNTWVRTDCIADNAEYRDIAKAKYPDVFEASQRAKEQEADYGIQGWVPNSNLNKFRKY